MRNKKGRHPFSLWASRIFEKSGIKRIFGLNLVAAMVVTGVVTPEANNWYNRTQLESRISETPIAIDPTTRTTFESPLADFRLSQSYSYWHPGIDMTAPYGSPVYAIENGFVAYTGYSLFGYGKHVIVSHNRHITSLYAHLSEITTVKGRKIARGEAIGRVGSTGWSTGNHLHLEIYEDGIQVNPLERLPIKSDDIKYDGAFGLSATPPATLTSPSPSAAN